MPVFESNRWSDQSYLSISSDPMSFDHGPSVPLHKYVYTDENGVKFYVSSSKPLSQNRLKE
jgi:hypothetical protein